MISPASLALADGSTMGTIDTSRLVRFPNVDRNVMIEPWVDRNPLETIIVKKIEAGKVSHITIMRTNTGTYSSDALDSTHVQYPGISNERDTSQKYVSITALGNSNSGSFLEW